MYNISLKLDLLIIKSYKSLIKSIGCGLQESPIRFLVDLSVGENISNK